MSTQEIQGTRAWPAVGGPQTLASDADRDTAAALLNAAWAEGRLTADEHDQRLSSAYGARTWQQLLQLTADLPAPPAAASGQPVPGIFAGADLCLLCMLLVACPPAWIAWLFFAGTAQGPIRTGGSLGTATRLCGGTMSGPGVVERYRRAAEPAVRGLAGVVVTVALGRAGQHAQDR